MPACAFDPLPVLVLADGVLAEMYIVPAARAGGKRVKMSGVSSTWGTVSRLAVATIAVSVVPIALSSQHAEAVWLNNQVCTWAPGGYQCTGVNQSGTWVGVLASSHGVDWSCNYSAWFYQVPPGGGVVSLGTAGSGGCGVRVVLEKPLNRSFAKGTRLCSKFYENAWGSFIGESCVTI